MRTAQSFVFDEDIPATAEPSDGDDSFDADPSESLLNSELPERLQSAPATAEARLLDAERRARVLQSVFGSTAGADVSASMSWQPLAHVRAAAGVEDPFAASDGDDAADDTDAADRLAVSQRVRRVGSPQRSPLMMTPLGRIASPSPTLASETELAVTDPASSAVTGEHKASRVKSAHVNSHLGYEAGHGLTPELEQKLKTYESIDFVEPVTELYVEYAAELAKHGGRRLKVLIIVLIGLLTGLWATLLFHTIDQLTQLRSHAALSVVANHGAGLGVLVQVGLALLCAIVASGCGVLLPSSAGSGVPEVMAYLNGVSMPGQFSLKLLVVKTISCVGAVVSGMPVGAEGPMIHIGALIGRGVGSGHSRTLGIGRGTVRGIFRPFQTAPDRRDFVTTGAAAGVTSVFGSALGGLLFVMEELASFFPKRLAWKTFVACLVTFGVQQIFNSLLDGWRLRGGELHEPVYFVKPRSGRVGEESHRDPLVISETVAALFNMRVVAAQLVPMDIRSFLPAVVVGIVCAVIAVGFIALHIRIATKWRARHIKRFTRRFALEPLAVSVFFALVWTIVPLAFPCERIPAAFFDPRRADLRELVLATEYCSENGDLKTATRYPTTAAPVPTHHNPFATLSMSSSYNTIRLLFSRNTESLEETASHVFLLNPVAVLVYFVAYTVGAAYCVGMNMASGVVIPTIVIGALAGRLVCGGWWNQPEWASPGVAGLIGAAAFFSGLSRLTFSVVIIMAEITNDLEHVPLVMFAAIIAKQLADRVNHSLYHEQLAVRGVPFLDFDRHIHKLDCFTAGDIMTPRPTTIPIVTSLREIVALLRTVDGSFHHGFPVVRHVQAQPASPGNPSGGFESAQLPAAGATTGRTEKVRPKFLGLITRDELRRLLWYMALWHRTQRPDRETSMEPGLDDLVASASTAASVRGTAADDPVPNDEGRSGDVQMPIPTFKELQDVDDARFWQQLPPLPEEFEALADNIVQLSESRLGPATEESTASTGSTRSEYSSQAESLPAQTPVPSWVKRTADIPFDLTPFIDLSANVVLSTTSVSRAYSLFRDLHLRHLCVVDSRNGLKGIITRRDLLGPSLAERCTQAFQAQRARVERGTTSQR